MRVASTKLGTKNGFTSLRGWRLPSRSMNEMGGSGVGSVVDIELFIFPPESADGLRVIDGQRVGIEQPRIDLPATSAHDPQCRWVNRSRMGS